MYSVRKNWTLSSIKISHDQESSRKTGEGKSQRFIMIVVTCMFELLRIEQNTLCLSQDLPNRTTRPRHIVICVLESVWIELNILSLS